MKNKTIFRTHVTGLSHHKYLFNIGMLNVGTVLTLKRASNVHDIDKAIGIHLAADQIGWVPKQDGWDTAQAMIAKLMDAGVKFTCKVAIHDPTHPDVQYRLYVDIAVASIPAPVHFGCQECAKDHREEGRREGIEAGKALHLMSAFGPTQEIAGIILPISLVDQIKAMGAEDKRAEVNTEHYKQGYKQGYKRDTDLKCAAAYDRGLREGQSKPCHSNMAEDMVVRMVSPKYFKTSSSLELELRSTGSTAMNVGIPALKFLPGDVIRVSIIKRGN